MLRLYYVLFRTEVEDEFYGKLQGDFTFAYSYSLTYYQSIDVCPLRLQDDVNSIVIGTYYGLGIYIGLTTVAIFISFTKSLLYLLITMRSSRNLHDQMYTAVIRSPVRFYDANPKGRILNRFSGDIDAIDTDVPEMIMEFCQVGRSINSMKLFLHPVFSIHVPSRKF